MIETILSLLGLGQTQRHRSADRFSVASTHLSNVEKLSLEVGVKLSYESKRLLALAQVAGVPPELFRGPLDTMMDQIAQIRSLVETNRRLLDDKGANEKVVAELERWAGTCQVMPTQVELTVKHIEDAISRHGDR